MSDYFTSDQHFGHANIIGYCGRPFRSTSEMDAGLVERWNAVVGPDDTVHVLGDICMGRREESMALINRLAGHKILYPGNHDRCWYGHGARAKAAEPEYLEAGFEEIRQGTCHLELGGRRVAVSHFPYRGDSGDADRFTSHRPADAGLWLLHGHVHEKWRVLDRMINVGVDVWDFTPVAAERLLAIMDGGGPS